MKNKFMNDQKGFAPIIIALIVAVVLGGGYLIVKQQVKKAEVPIISADVFKNATYRIVFPSKDVTPPREFTMIDGFAQNIDKVQGGCNIVNINSNTYLHPDSKELLVATIDQSGNKGVVAVYCNYGASANDIFLVAFKSLNSVPVQTDAVNLRNHPDLQSRNLFRVGVKQIALDANGVLTVTALVVPDALRNAPGVQQNASESVAISYSLDNQGKLISTSTLNIDPTANWNIYTNEKYGFSIQYPTGTKIDLSDTSGKKVGFQPITTKGDLSIDVIQSSANCFDTASGADPTYKTIGGINFTVWSESKGYSTGLDTWASARLYCTSLNGYEYNMITKLPYKAGTTPLDVDKDAVLNQILSTFKFTTPSTATFSVTGNNLSVVNDGKVTQTLSLGEQGIFALNVVSGNKPPTFIIDKDVNFDGHNDVGFLSGSGYGGVNYFYDFYIFNPNMGRLEKNAVLSGVGNIRLDPVKKQVISTYKSGPGYVSDMYQWNGSTFIKSGPVSATQ